MSPRSDRLAARRRPRSIGGIGKRKRHQVPRRSISCDAFQKKSSISSCEERGSEETDQEINSTGFIEPYGEVVHLLSSIALLSATNGAGAAQTDGSTALVTVDYLKAQLHEFETRYHLGLQRIVSETEERHRQKEASYRNEIHSLRENVGALNSSIKNIQDESIRHRVVDMGSGCCLSAGLLSCLFSPHAIFGGLCCLIGGIALAVRETFGYSPSQKEPPTRTDDEIQPSDRPLDVSIHCPSLLATAACQLPPPRSVLLTSAPVLPDTPSIMNKEFSFGTLKPGGPTSSWGTAQSDSRCTPSSWITRLRIRRTSTEPVRSDSRFVPTAPNDDLPTFQRIRRPNGAQRMTSQRYNRGGSMFYRVFGSDLSRNDVE